MSEVAESEICAQCGGTGVCIDSSGPVILADICKLCLSHENNWLEGERRRQVVERLVSANIPSIYSSAMNAPILHLEISQWIDGVISGSLRKNLFLYGPPGVGKSYAAISAISAFLNQSRNVFYLDVTSYINDIRRRHQTHFDDHVRRETVGRLDEIHRRLRYFDLVVLDNIGRSNVVTEFIIDQYADLISRRFESGKPTLFLSNHGPHSSGSFNKKSLADKIGEISAHKIFNAVNLELKCRLDQYPKPDTVDFDIIHFKARSMSKSESTLLHVWARLGLFRLISHQERSRLTRSSVIYPKEVVEVPQAREFVGWGGYHVIQTGAVVDQYDCAVLVAVLKLYHQRGRNGVVAFSLAELGEELSIKSAGSGSIHKSLKRSLNRLVESKVRIKKMDQGQLTWAGGFIDSLSRDGDNLRARTVVRLNDFIVSHYRDNLFSYLHLPSLLALNSFYAQGIFRCLASHRDQYKFIGLARWRLLLGVSDDVSEREFRRKMRSSLRELIQAKLLTDQSHLDEDDVLHTFLVKKSCSVNITPDTAAFEEHP